MKACASFLPWFFTLSVVSSTTLRVAFIRGRVAMKASRWSNTALPSEALAARVVCLCEPRDICSSTGVTLAHQLPCGCTMQAGLVPIDASLDAPSNSNHPTASSARSGGAASSQWASGAALQHAAEHAHQE